MDGGGKGGRVEARNKVPTEDLEVIGSRVFHLHSIHRDYIGEKTRLVISAIFMFNLFSFSLNIFNLQNLHLFAYNFKIVIE